MQFLLAFLVGLGSGTWVYTKTMRSTGNNTKSALIGAGVVGAVVFLIIFTLARMFLS